MPDTLIWAHSALRPVFTKLPSSVQAGARSLYRWLLSQRYGQDGLAIAVQNERSWRLDPLVALRGEVAELETIQAFRRVVQPGMDVIDVGANVGQMTLELAHLVGDQGRVVAVEPGPGNLRLLERHVQGNGMGDRVLMEAAACTDQPDQTITLNILGSDTDDIGSGFSVVDAAKLPNPHQLPTHAYPVSTTTVDALVARYALTPGFLKIDVEGAELQVLQGAQQTLKQYRPIVLVGFHPFAFEDAIAAGQALMNLLPGYSLATLAGETVAYPQTLAEYLAQPLPDLKP
ncbi:MAG: FkbM family methyltransferase [Leptolyngbya sp. DLM2.Bin15]|nr:MAG: FkbM family methyltransferase [Leptolyngbya sp. DLM2.Bin15]